MGYADKSGMCQRRGMIGEPDGAQAGDDAEGEVERAHEDACGKTHGAGWDTEVGDEPESVWGERGSDAGDERFQLRLGEAVEEEMSNHEVVPSTGYEGERVAVVCFQPRSIALATLA